MPEYELLNPTLLTPSAAGYLGWSYPKAAERTYQAVTATQAYGVLLTMPVGTPIGHLVINVGSPAPSGTFTGNVNLGLIDPSSGKGLAATADITSTLTGLGASTFGDLAFALTSPYTTVSGSVYAVWWQAGSFGTAQPSLEMISATQIRRQVINSGLLPSVGITPVGSSGLLAVGTTYTLNSAASSAAWTPWFGYY